MLEFLEAMSADRGSEGMLSLRQVAKLLGLSEPRIYQMDAELQPILIPRGSKMKVRWYDPAVVERVRADRAAAENAPGPALQLLWRRLTKQAESLGVELRLQIWDLVFLGTLPCHFCGVKPTPHVLAGETILHHDLERMDHRLGFTMVNTVPCCELCASMMGELDGAAFLRQVLTIARRRMLYTRESED